MVVVLNMPSGVYSQVSPKVFRLGRKSFGRWRWEVLLNEDEMEKVKRRWFWNGLKKSAWPILEFVTLRSKFVTLIFRTLGGEKMRIHTRRAHDIFTSKKITFYKGIILSMTFPITWELGIYKMEYHYVFEKYHITGQKMKIRRRKTPKTLFAPAWNYQKYS